MSLTLKEAVYGPENVNLLGKELKEMVMAARNSKDLYEAEMAEQVINDYYASNSGNVEPLSDVYYTPWANKVGDVRISRNQMLSPKGALFMNFNDSYFDGVVKGEKYVDDGSMDLRIVITMNISITGKQLRVLCENMLNMESDANENLKYAYLDYQKQLAKHIMDRFYSEGNKMMPGDSVWYKVRLQITGVPQVIRDVKLSPRPLSAAEREWNAAHPDDI